MAAPSAPRAYSYIRFSSPEQVRGDSLRRQLEWSQRYAEEHGLFLDEELTFRDLGVSAFDKSNLAPGGKLREFIDAIDRGQVLPGSYLLVESLDRISRAQIMDALRIFLDILSRGITIVTKDGMVYASNLENQHQMFSSLLISIATLFRAHEESLTKSNRLKEVWKRKRDKIRDHQHKLTSQCPAWLRLSSDGTRFEVIPEHSAIVMRIIEMVQSGLGKASIAKRLNREGIPSFGGRNRQRTWFESYITKIIRSRALVGEFQPHHRQNGKSVAVGEPVIGYYPSLISDEEFALLQERVSERGRRSGGNRGRAFPNLFTGLRKCGYCGSTLSYVDKGIDLRRNSGDSAYNRFLVCNAAKRGTGCRRYLTWNYEKFEDAFFAHATKTDFSHFVRESATTVGSISRGRNQIVIERAKRGQLVASRDRLIEAIASGEGDHQKPKAIVDKILEYEGQIGECDRRLEELEVEVASAAVRQRASEDAIAALREVFATMHELQGEDLVLFRTKINEHLRRVIEHIVLYPGGSIRTAEQALQIRNDLVAKGQYPVKVIDKFIQAEISTSPRTHDSYFAIKNRRQGVQIVRPNDPVPDIFEIMDKYPELWREKVRILREDALVAGDVIVPAGAIRRLTG
ncbi:MAG TPA: recombinase family protein [Usitatibacter sp.]|nr:recombinase family protein [Usitatibacter sp.]